MKICGTITKAFAVAIYALLSACYNYDFEERVVVGEGDNAPSWALSIGGTSSEIRPHIIRASDGTYILATDTLSFGAKAIDAWVVKFYGDGRIAWQNKIGGNYDDKIFSIVAVSDGGCVIAGSSNSFITNDTDMWVTRLDTNGAIVWQRLYGNTLTDTAYSICQTADGGFALAGGITNIDDPEAAPVGRLIKIDADGGVVWQRSFAGIAASVAQTNDNGLVVIGENYSGSYPPTSSDIWIMKTNENGAIIWRRSFSGGGRVLPVSVIATADNGYVISSHTNSFSGDAYNYDFWLIKVDGLSTPQWQYTYANGSFDYIFSIYQGSDGGLVLTGCTAGWFPSYVSSSDGVAIIMKLNAFGSPVWQKSFSTGGNDIAFSACQTGTGNILAAGISNSFTPGNSSIWLFRLDRDGAINFAPAAGITAMDISFNISNAASKVTTKTDDTITTISSVRVTTTINAVVNPTNCDILSLPILNSTE